MCIMSPFHLCDLQVRFEGSACLESLLIRGPRSDQQDCVMEVNGRECVHVRDCAVEGERYGATVAVSRDGSVLKAPKTRIHNSCRRGLHVDQRGKAVLKGCRCDGCSSEGWSVHVRGSSLTACDSCCSRTQNGNNAQVCGGGTAHIERCALDNSRSHGLVTYGSDSFVSADATSFSGNKCSNIHACV